MPNPILRVGTKIQVEQSALSLGIGENYLSATPISLEEWSGEEQELSEAAAPTLPLQELTQ